MKRLLIISNEPFSDNTSNGRTMKKLLASYDTDKLAQFYLHGVPDRDFCNRYFRVSDRDALNAFLHRTKQAPATETAPEFVSAGSVPVAPAGERPAVKRSCRNLVLRDIIWNSYSWWNADFDAFLDGFSPEVVLIQAGDAPFMFHLARKIANRYQAKLMQFSTENYVLKKYMYSDAHQERFWHFFLQRRMKSAYAAFMKRADYCIYNTDQLEEDYQKKYPHPGKSAVIYTVTELAGQIPSPSVQNSYFRVVYCGNLGVGRVQALAKFAQILNQVDPQAKLEVYGRFVCEEDRQLLCTLPSVIHKGVIPYDEVIGVLQGADMIIHCENPEWIQDLWMAFSTKIADSLAVGTPFLVFADRQYPFVKYLSKHNCAHIAGNEAELETVLKQCLTDKAYLRKYLENAMALAITNHSRQSNCQTFLNIISQLS